MSELTIGLMYGVVTLLSIPLFILKGAAIGKSPAGRDLYGAIHAWLHKIPGGLGIAVGLPNMVMGGK